MPRNKKKNKEKQKEEQTTEGGTEMSTQTQTNDANTGDGDMSQADEPKKTA